jgi:hypothetical protein
MGKNKIRQKITEKVLNSLYSILYSIKLIAIFIKIRFYPNSMAIRLTVSQITTKIIQTSFKLFEKGYCGWQKLPRKK